MVLALDQPQISLPRICEAMKFLEDMMSRFIFSASVAIGMALSASAFAQSATTPDASPTCNRTATIASQNPPTSSAATMADTSSDSGKTGAGASSMSMGTGPTDKTGVMSPCAPGAQGDTATGAMPTSTGAATTP
jgi:hypothetical protein